MRVLLEHPHPSGRALQVGQSIFAVSETGRSEAIRRLVELGLKAKGK